MLLAITGAGGFVGRAVVRRLEEIGFDGTVRLIDRTIAPQAGFECLQLDLTDIAALQQAMQGVDRVLHLAASPGGASEADPALSRRANLEVSLDLIAQMNGRRLIYASSIAVFGDCFPALVEDETAPEPSSVYGTHKRMVELAFADAVRRNQAKGVALRLPGIVARSNAASGFGSAFLSDLFHAIRAGDAMTIPVSETATSWLLSVQKCAENLVHALLSDFTEHAALTLPAVWVRVEDLVRSAARYGDASRIEFAEDATTQRVFGSYPPLETRRASALGFLDDGATDSLVDTVMQGLAA